MSRSSLIISDFSTAVVEKDRLTPRCCPSLWEIQRYETANIKGQALIASANTLPQPVTITPNLTGWYRIYLCTMCTSYTVSENRIELKLTDDEFPRTLGANRIGPHIQWGIFEKVEEAYWKSADMTGQTITISKPNDETAHTASLFWLRFEPMSDEEIQIHLLRLHDSSCKTMYAHMDGDFMYMDDPQTPHDYCRFLSHMKDSDVKIVGQEITNDLVEFEKLTPETLCGRSAWTPRRIENFTRLHRQREEIYKEELSYAHKHGMELFAAQRMSLSNFSFPYADVWNFVPFIEEHPEYYCRARNGKTVTFLSYAYQEVQDFVIGSFLTAARQGFDGITLIFTRGICVLFEQPVIDRFRAKYGDTVDYCRLPESDPRLAEIRSDVMTEFMQRLRQALDNFAAKENRPPLKIYITSYFSVPEIKNSGVDVERFAKEGLIDGVIQSNMTLWEETDDVLDEDGLINLEKYTKKAETQYIIRRSHGNELDRTLAGLCEYRRIADTYGIKLYSEIQWENSEEPESFLKSAKEIYKNGGQHIALWDCYPARVSRPAEWNCVSQLGDGEQTLSRTDEPTAYRTLHKILSYGKHDMSLYQANWRG